MKMLSGHVTELRELVEPLDTAERRARYLAGDYPNADKTKHLDKRYRWDLLHALPDATRQRLFNKWYQYLNDLHIDTALCSIVRELRG